MSVPKKERLCRNEKRERLCQEAKCITEQIKRLAQKRAKIRKLIIELEG